MNPFKHIPTFLDHLIWVILVGVFLFFVSQSEHFLTQINISNILSAAAVLGVLVVGQTFVLISGNFDLSTESTLGLAALMGIWLIVPAGAPYFGSGFLFNPFLSIAVILAMGGGYWVSDRIAHHLGQDEQLHCHSCNAFDPTRTHARIHRRQRDARVKFSSG